MGDIRQLYQSDFDGIAYANEYLIGDDYEHKWTSANFYHRVFSQGKVTGESLLEVGCGPTMRSALSASAYVSEIFLSDLLESNCASVRKWLQNSSDSLDLSKMYKHVANLEGKDNIKYLEDRVRKCVKDVILCDILSDNPLSPLQQFDIVASSLCLDCFPDYNDYTRAWLNLAALTRSGGYVISVGTIESSHYKAGDKTLPAANVNESSAKKCYKSIGFKDFAL